MRTPSSPSRAQRVVVYPTRDGKPMAETPVHRDHMIMLLDMLKGHYAHDPSVYVSANMLMYYVEGDKHKHVAPDVFVAKGVGDKEREAYFVWEEGKGPDFVFECTSRSTRNEDLKTKFALYRDELKAGEYFLFDPKGEYLRPPLKGFRLVGGQYEVIEEVEGRLPSVELGLHLELEGEGERERLRLYDPNTGRYLQTAAEAAQERAEAERQRADEWNRRWRESEAERERLVRALEELRRKHGQDG